MCYKVQDVGLGRHSECEIHSLEEMHVVATASLVSVLNIQHS
jgi:hypothetical protein